jgi:hypothetical protein
VNFFQLFTDIFEGCIRQGARLSISQFLPLRIFTTEKYNTQNILRTDQHPQYRQLQLGRDGMSNWLSSALSGLVVIGACSRHGEEAAAINTLGAMGGRNELGVFVE